MGTATYVVQVKDAEDTKEQLVNLLMQYGNENRVSGAYFELTDEAAEKVMEIVIGK